MDLPDADAATARALTKPKRLNFIIAIASVLVREDGSTLETTMLDEEVEPIENWLLFRSSGTGAKVSDSIRLH